MSRYLTTGHLQSVGEDGRARACLCNVNRPLKVLLFGVHVTSGQPVRGTEVATI